MKKLFIVFLMAAPLLNGANRFEHLSRLPEDSVLRSRCEQVPQSWFINSNVESACEKLNRMLADVDETGFSIERKWGQQPIYYQEYDFDRLGQHWSECVTQRWGKDSAEWAMIKVLTHVAYEAGQKTLISVILADQHNRIKRAEYNKLSDYECELYEAYKKRELEKCQRKFEQTGK